MDWARTSKDGIDLTVRVTPRAARTAVTGEHNGMLAIRLQAPPVDGKANKALMAFLAKTLGVSKTSITLVAGDKSRVKRLHIRDITAARARETLAGHSK